MQFKKLMTTAMVLGAMTFGATTASATEAANTLFNQTYANNTQSCYVCHTGTPGPLTAYGIQYVSNGGLKGGTASALGAIEQLDADNDGTVNLDEINAGTLPDDAPTTSSSSSSGGGCMTGSISTPLMMFLVMLSLGFVVRRNKD